MVKLQTTSRGTHLVSIPKKYVKALRWQEDEEFALCPNFEKRTLTLIPLRA
jgi:hypothetical protein